MGWQLGSVGNEVEIAQLIGTAGENGKKFTYFSNNNS